MVAILNHARSVGPSFTTSSGDSEALAVIDNGAGAGLQTPSGGLSIQEDDFNPEKIADDAIRYLYVEVDRMGCPRRR